MQIDENTPRSEITIGGATFSAPEPYTEGHTLTENEASAFNQLLHENLRNNFASKVKAALEAVNGAVDQLDMEGLQSAFDEYAAGYEFGARRTGTRVSVDPVLREASKMAKDLIRKALKQQKIAEKDLPEGKMDELISQTLERRPAIMDLAREKVESAKKLASLGVADIAA